MWKVYTLKSCKNIQFWKSCKKVYYSGKFVKSIQFWKSCEKVYNPKKVLKKHTTLDSSDGICL